MTTSDKPNSRHRLMARFNKPFRKPDWRQWENIPNAPIWKVVALSCDIDPYALEGWIDSPPTQIPPSDFLHRLEQVISALVQNGGPLVATPTGSTPALHRVGLGDFRSWATSVGFLVPDEFPVFEISNPSFKSLQEKKLRLTMEIAYEKSIGTRNPVATVATRVFNEKTKRNGISTSRLTALVGSVLAQAERLAAYRKANPSEYLTAFENIAARRRTSRSD